ncbi:Nucleoside-diphosphate-sugar epimerase [Chryseobacterium oranimense]|uniref:Nucleoside-diphosphate-sugar epimerase n=1 Tax=Chryseobacterium oranimense TaxID=421058 RepID=A0A1M5LXS5_9FLAO|nr:NAD-dependent epimerase/dehydratase family protein [Chryseobacterium oranimense]SHG69449.1 Nucleoside-diphosphate-sugar epimerase [Chryseobacterium oranimense]
MENILLFGASGFLGSHLKKSLPQNIVPVNIRKENWQEEMPYDVSVFINCIGKAHDHSGIATEKDFYQANFEVVKSLFKEFINSKAFLFIHISSIAVVEENERAGIINEQSECFPVSHYGKSKKAAEDYLLAQQIPEGKKLIILRPVMIHGDGDKGNLKLLYKIISKGIPYPLGSFNNLRSFISVDNVAYLLNEIIIRWENINSGIYNICDDYPISTKQIIEIIAQSQGRKAIILYLPIVLINFFAKTGDLLKLPFNTKRLKKMTSNLIISNEKIKHSLGIKELPLSASDGLEKTIKSFNNVE